MATFKKQQDGDFNNTVLLCFNYLIMVWVWRLLHQ